MKFALSLLTLFLFSTAALAQTEGQSAASTPEQKTSAPIATISAAEKFDAERIPRNSKVYIGRFSKEGDNDKKEFESYLAAAMRKKEVPLLIVTVREEADFIIEGTPSLIRQRKEDEGHAAFRPPSSLSLFVLSLWVAKRRAGGVASPAQFSDAFGGTERRLSVSPT